MRRNDRAKSRCQNGIREDKNNTHTQHVLDSTKNSTVQTKTDKLKKGDECRQKTKAGYRPLKTTNETK